MAKLKRKEGYKCDGAFDRVSIKPGVFKDWQASQAYLDVPDVVALDIDANGHKKFEVVEYEFQDAVARICALFEIKPASDKNGPKKEKKDLKAKAEILEKLSKKELKKMTKDQINDAAALRGIEIKGHWTHKKMEDQFLKQQK